MGFIIIMIKLFFINFGVHICLALNISDTNRQPIPGYFRWHEDTVASDYLMCPNSCEQHITKGRTFAGNSVTTCCVEYSRPYWIISKSENLIGSIRLEPRGEQGFVIVSGVANDTLLNKILYQQGNLNVFPSSLCEFRNIVDINFSQNQIENIPDIACLHILDTLNLSFNRIERLTNTTFRVLEYLRVLDLSDNKIQYIEPNTFNYRPGSLMKILLCRNFLKSIDLTNLFLDYSFDFIQLSSNHISEFTNELDFKFNLSKGGGNIYLVSNQISESPNFSKLGLTLPILYSMAFRYPINIIDNPIDCNCKVEPFLEQFKLASKNFVEMQNHTCGHPPFLRGRHIFNISADLFICNISMKDKCPFNCSCFEQPSRSRLVVNCTMRGKYRLPSEFPWHNGLYIDLSHNLITVFVYRTFLDRTSSIDLSYNRIKRVDPLIYGIPNINNINLRHNSISQIHKNVQLFKNERTVQFGHITITCSCEMKWIQVWLENQNKRRRGYNFITCLFQDEVIDAISFSQFCTVEKTQSTVQYALLILLLFVLISLVLYLTMKYEIFLLLRNFRMQNFSRFNSFDSPQPTRFDVYSSFNTENYNIMKWVNTVVVPNLERNGFKVCLPPRDFTLGGVQVEQILTEIANSNSYLVILSKDYLKSQFQKIEWNQIWAQYKSNKCRRIAVVNYDILDSSHIKDRRLKAFVRLGHTFDFCNFDNKLMDNIKTRL
ncbi:protein toll-like [Mytilus trossulus]|uniref:protein toll-like n=1 Tax=Mytilus trossulus TaxID=6551 RepID=UPI003003A962